MSRGRLGTAPVFLLLVAWSAACADGGVVNPPAVEPPNRAPVAEGAIPADTVSVGYQDTVQVSQYFSDPDDDALVYTAATSDAATASVAVSGADVILSASAEGTVTVTVTATDPGGLSAQQAFAVTVVLNQAPRSRAEIDDLEIIIGKASLEADKYFADPEGALLTYTVETSEAVVAFGYATERTLEVVAAARGTATLTVTASDLDGLAAQQTFRVTVSNQPPWLVDEISNLRLGVGDTAVIDASGFFRDPEGDPLTYTVHASPGGRVSTAVSGSMVRVSALSSGEVEMVVAASDGETVAEQELNAIVTQVARPRNARYQRKDTTMMLAWSPSGGATHYNIYHSSSYQSREGLGCQVDIFGEPWFCDQLAMNVQDTTYVHIDPHRERNYYWITACVLSECSALGWAGVPAWSPSVEVVGRDHVSLTVKLKVWRTYPLFFQLYRNTSASGEYSLVSDRIETGGQQIIRHADGGLDPDAVYHYAARICSPAGCSGFSEMSAGMTEAEGSVAIPPAVTGLEGEKVHQLFRTDNARIWWEAVPGATYYRIYEEGAREAEVSAPRTGYYDYDPPSFLFARDVSPYQVLACNRAGCSSTTAAVVVPTLAR